MISYLLHIHAPISWIYRSTVLKKYWLRNCQWLFNKPKDSV
ncbi:unnamed protein product [Trichobilharzia regenti]|nr:unnamed protein product [Trichobilharzia regenti]